MRVLTPGHNYELAYFEDAAAAGQRLQFIEKTPVPNCKGELVTINDGTTNEEVLKMLINRLMFLANKLPSRATSIAITKCEEALMWLEKRTRDRQERGVEGTHNP